MRAVKMCYSSRFHYVLNAAVPRSTSCSCSSQFKDGSHGTDVIDETNYWEFCHESAFGCAAITCIVLT